MVTLNERQRNLLEFLWNKNQYVSIKEMSEIFQVSERTIRYDLDNISLLLKNSDITIQRSPKLGTKLIFNGNRNREMLVKLFTGAENSFYSQNERVLILCLLILIEGSTLEVLAEKVGVSKNTIVQDIKKVREVLKNLDVNLESKIYEGIKATGEEEIIRYAFMNLYYKVKDNSFIDIYNFIAIDDLISKHNIKEFIGEVEKQLRLEYSECSVDELTIIILYSLKRVSLGNFIKNFDGKPKELTKNDEFKVIKNSTEKLFNKNIILTDEEINYLVKWFKSAKIMSFLDSTNKESINEIKHITTVIVQDMEQRVGVEFSRDLNFINSVAMHLSVAIYRLKNNFIIENPLKEEIKYRIGLIYQMTESVLKKHEKNLDIVFPDEEIAYMAMHFGAAFEKNANRIFMSRVLVVCNSGLSTSGLLSTRLKTMIPELNIIGICRLDNLEEELKKEQVDFIITTVPINSCKYRAVQVNPLLNMEDINIIKKLVFNNVYEKSCKYLIKRYKENDTKAIANIIPRDHISFNVNINDWRQAIRIAALPLLEKKYIEESYINSMIKIVEELGTYMVFIPGIAFIHALPEYVNENSISFITLKDEINFGDKSDIKVKAIVVLANKNENENLIDLINILIKGDNVSKFKMAESYNELEILYK